MRDSQQERLLEEARDCGQGGSVELYRKRLLLLRTISGAALLALFTYLWSTLSGRTVAEVVTDSLSGVYGSGWRAYHDSVTDYAWQMVSQGADGKAATEGIVTFARAGKWVGFSLAFGHEGTVYRATFGADGRWSREWGRGDIPCKSGSWMFTDANLAPDAPLIGRRFKGTYTCNTETRTFDISNPSKELFVSEWFP